MHEIQAVADLGDICPQNDPPPAAVIAAAHAALADRTPGADIAALVFDSVFQDSVATEPRDDSCTRVLLFVAPGLALMVGARRLHDGTELAGRYISGTQFDVCLRIPGIGPIPLTQTVTGEFGRRAVPQSPISFMLVARSSADLRTVVTDPVVV